MLDILKSLLQLEPTETVSRGTAFRRFVVTTAKVSRKGSVRGKKRGDGGQKSPLTPDLRCLTFSCTRVDSISKFARELAIWRSSPLFPLGHHEITIHEAPFFSTSVLCPFLPRKGHEVWAGMEGFPSPDCALLFPLPSDYLCGIGPDKWPEGIQNL